MWPRLREVVDGAFAVSLDEAASADTHPLAEQARVVAQVLGRPPARRPVDRVQAETVCCIVSGGNIDASKLAAILAR